MTLKPVAVLLSLAILLGACGDSDPTISTTTSTLVVASSSTTTASDAVGTPAPSRFDPGTAVDLVGVVFDESTWIQPTPADGVDGSGLFEADRIDSNLIATGRAYIDNEGVVWEEFEARGAAATAQPFGYFPQEKVGVVGPALDETPQVGGLTDDTFDGLVALVVVQFANLEGAAPRKITAPPDSLDVYYDLINPPDGVKVGTRIHIVVEESGGTFTVDLTELSEICFSGLDDSGTCA